MQALFWNTVKKVNEPFHAVMRLRVSRLEGVGRAPRPHRSRIR